MEKGDDFQVIFQNLINHYQLPPQVAAELLKINTCNSAARSEFSAGYREQRSIF